MKRSTLLTILILLIAAGVRLSAINCQLWLDEVWSIQLANANCRSALDVFTLHHDNNHWLNTLWVYALGPGRQWWVYHILSEVCGIGTVVLGVLLTRRHGAMAAIAAAVLLGGCEFLVEFSSDARGYAPAGFFALLCWQLLEQQLLRPRRMTAALMCASAVLGTLSHLTFVVILIALIAMTAQSRWRQKSWAAAMIRIGLWWSIPIATLALLYIVDIRHMIRGGGPPTPADLPSQAAAMVLGIPVGNIAAPIFGVLAMVLCAMQIIRLYRAADPAWPMVAIAFVFVPAVLYCWPRTDYLHPRYIYVAVPVLLVALAIEISRWRLPLVVGALAAFVGVNILPIVQFLRYGRGDYLGALQFVFARTQGENVVIAADNHPDSTMMVVQYYCNYYLHDPRRVLTFKSDAWGDQWPQWLVSEQNYGTYVTSRDGVPFALRADYPKGAVTSGIPWAIYEAAAGRANARGESLRSLGK